jgi:hypothetical protein
LFNKYGRLRRPKHHRQPLVRRYFHPQRTVIQAGFSHLALAAIVLDAQLSLQCCRSNTAGMDWLRIANYSRKALIQHMLKIELHDCSGMSASPN